MSRSPSRTAPEVGSAKPATMRSVVVLPQPDGPEQDHELAVGDIERDVAHRIDVAVALGDAIDLEPCHGRLTPPG